MAATNFTPIQLYRTATASTVPLAGNLADGELAINTNDGKLYYKDSGGVVQLLGIKNPADLGTAQTLTNKTLTDPTLADSKLIRAMLIDGGYTYYNSNTTSALDYVNGSHQRWAPTGTVTLTVANWPPTGNLGQILIEGVNLGAATITWPTVNWIQPSGVTTTSISTYLSALGRTLQSSGTDFALLWTRDAGTTLYGKLL